MGVRVEEEKGGGDSSIILPQSERMSDGGMREIWNGIFIFGFFFFNGGKKSFWGGVFTE